MSIAAPLLWTRRPFCSDSAPWLRAGGPCSAHRGTFSSGVGTGLRGSSSQLFRIVVLDFCQLASPAARFSPSSGYEEQDWVPLTILLLVASCCEFTSSTFPSSRKVAILMTCGTLLSQPTRIVMGFPCSNFIANASHLLSWQQVTFNLSRGDVFPTQFVPPRRSVQALFAGVVVDFVYVLRCIRPQTPPVHSLGARDIEYHVFEHQHSLQQDCSRSD